VAAIVPGHGIADGQAGKTRAGISQAILIFPAATCTTPLFSLSAISTGMYCGSAIV
jgi:hypothetical protein